MSSGCGQCAATPVVTVAVINVIGKGMTVDVCRDCLSSCFAIPVAWFDYVADHYGIDDAGLAAHMARKDAPDD